jgi:hypothetical protein
MAQAVEEARMEATLEHLDLLAHRRLPEIEQLGRPRE